jgi:acetoacetyl-CoA reductase
MTDRRVAIVTGGTRGVGRAITEALSSSGVHVAAGYNSDHDSAQKMLDELGSEGSVSLHQGNVGVPEDCNRVVGEVLEAYGRVDYLVNNAGVTIDKSVRRMTIEQWHGVLRINLSGSFYMIKATLDHMLERQFGRIVNISSIIGEIGNIGQANYAASKAGLFGLTKSLALETATKGITVNCVAPGFTDTDMLATVPEAALKAVISRIPMGRLGTPTEIAYAVQFLLDDRASYITGTVLPVNGGMDM